VTSNDEYVLELLLENDYISQEQYQYAQSQVGSKPGSGVDILVREKVIEELHVLQVLGDVFGMEVVTLHGVEIEPAVRDMVPVDIARRYRVVPVYKTDDTLTIAFSDPLEDTIDSLRYVLKCQVDGLLATSDEVRVLLDKYYQSETSVDDIMKSLDDDAVDVEMHERLIPVDEAATESDAPIIKLVSMLILEAYRNRASDIHLEPMEKRFRVRYRIDGVLHEVDSPPKRLQSAIINRVKLMASMKISEKRIPQDGRIQVNVRGRELDLRVSTVPSSQGESIVMRILDKQNVALGLPKLGFFSDDQQTFENLIASPDGIILVTGPTGSGKTTTLYACLNYINRPDRKIITVEDPVEYQLSGINQVQVVEDIGMTFSAALRAILRQAPNIVMIGEIRDLETATIATEASLTGHLVFSTLHTNDAPSAVTRLQDIGVKPFLVASALRAVMAQRLLRSICDQCKEEYQPERGEVMGLGPQAEMLLDQPLMRGRGCAKCSLTGYSGRKGIFEIFLMDDALQHMIFEKRPVTELRRYAREQGMRTLREDGIRKVAAGVTTVAEVMRVTMGDSD
jgi:type IV pilus assembly protein PilB